MSPAIYLRVSMRTVPAECSDSAVRCDRSRRKLPPDFWWVPCIVLLPLLMQWTRSSGLSTGTIILPRPWEFQSVPARTPAAWPIAAHCAQFHRRGNRQACRRSNNRSLRCASTTCDGMEPGITFAIRISFCDPHLNKWPRQFRRPVPPPHLVWRPLVRLVSQRNAFQFGTEGF